MNAIGWCDETWNPMTGCSHISEACENCYAERMAARFGKNTWAKRFSPEFHPDRLDRPLHWRKPRRIFVCSMSDLFHEAFTDEQVTRVLNVAWHQAPQHTYIVLTKRPERMREIIASGWTPRRPGEGTTYLPNVWLGVTVENQARADERIPILIDTPAAVRFVCCEPLLGPVHLEDGFMSDEWGCPDIDWVIAGGENGPGARLMNSEWALDLYRQCKAERVPFWYKGPGSNGVGPFAPSETLEALEMFTSHRMPSAAAT